MAEITIQEYALRNGREEKALRRYCREGKIPGAKKVGMEWLLPEDAPYPEDKRKRSPSLQPKRPLPLGVSDYIEAVRDYYYVDKTLFIKDILDTMPKVSLFTRPRRFGKTLNMSMLRAFFERSEVDTSIYFKDKAIARFGSKYMSHQGRYPVIYLSFKDVKYPSWEASRQKILSLVRAEYIRHKDSFVTDVDQDLYRHLVNEDPNDVDLCASLYQLSAVLREKYNESVMIIIDEYDTPLQNVFTRDNAHFQDAVLFIRNLFSEAFKDNPNLALGFLTGILRIAKESIFSGMNNLDENSIFDTRYSTYFGFTKEECRRILSDFGYAEKYEDLERWYDGYRFGGEDIFNPWSVLSFLQKQGSVGAYWENTGENAILGELLFDANEETKEGLVNLFMGKKVYALVDTAITYPNIHDNPDAIYSFLMTCGYLKVDSGPITEGSNDYYLSIPNREIQSIFAREVLNRMGGGASTASHIRHAIINGDITSFVSSLAAYIKASISIKDAQYESFYHGLVLGLLSCLDNVYDPLSNRESGEGYYDIVLSPRARKFPGIILEFKARTAKESRSLTALKDEAMKQMDVNHYEEELHRVGVERILKIGIAFDRKDVLADYKEENGQN